MTLLVADVGGTNTRIAISRDAGQIAEPERYHNADFASFYDVLHRYAGKRDLSGLTGGCIAVAGPVTGGRARLTNRDWCFDLKTVAGLLPSIAPGQMHLVNDLVALGYALPDQTLTRLFRISAHKGAGPLNKQALVVGMGTGFNICVVKPTANGPVVVEAELGHASPPANVSHALAAVLGPDAEQFTTYEHLFSGRGLTRLYRHFSGGVEMTGPQIVASYDPARQDASAQAVELAARMLGLVSRELVFQYLPYGGIHFAGGAARGILGSPARDMFLNAFNTPGPFAEHVSMVPLQVITDDAAALIGAARYAGTVKFAT